MNINGIASFILDAKIRMRYKNVVIVKKGSGCMGLFGNLFGTSNHSSNTSLKSNSPQLQKKGPSSDILEVVRNYEEIGTVEISEEECIRRCDEMITELEWYSNISRTSAMDPEVRKANFEAIWHTICDHDMVYHGKKYPMDMMSNIGLKIIESSN